MNTISLPSQYYNYNHQLPFDWLQVLRLEAHRNYTAFILKNGDKYLSTKTLGNYEPFLPPYFIRIHKSFIVNAEAILRVNHSAKTILLQDGFIINVARRRWKSVRTKNFQSSPSAV